MIKCQQAVYKILSILLGYPDNELYLGLDELDEHLKKEIVLSTEHQKALSHFIHDMKKIDLLALQEAYVTTFDRNPRLSLHLFEHVHGDSRDRGQAMVDLSHVYAQQGLSLKARELPDYLPAFLDFLSVLSPTDANDLLDEALPIITSLGARLRKYNNRYAVIFDVLLSLSCKEIDANIVNKILADDKDAALTLDEIDKAWEEKPVHFGQQSACLDCGTQTPHQEE